MPDIQILDLTRKPKYRVRLPGGTEHDLAPFDVAAFQMLDAIQTDAESGTPPVEQLVAVSELVRHLLPTAAAEDIRALDAPELWQIINQASASALAMVQALKNGVAPAATTSPPAPAIIPRSRRRTSAATSSPG